MTRYGDPWRVNALAQRAGLFCLRVRGYLEEAAELIRREREFLKGKLKEIDGLKVFSGEANFLLLRGEREGFSAAALYRHLASRGILIRNAANFPGLDGRYFRLAVLQREKNIRLLKELGKYFSGF